MGVVGCGYWGPNIVRNFNEIEDLKLKYCCDLDSVKLKNIQKKYPSVIITQDYNDLLNDPEIDIIAIVTSISSHFKLAKDALLSNKHVFVEKPLVYKSEEAKELIKLAKERNKVLMVGHTFEYSPAVHKLKEIVDGGELGRVYYIYSQRLNLGLFQKDVNVVWDLAPHDISIILYLLNKEVSSVSARGKSHVINGIEDVAFIDLKFKDDSIAHIHVSWLDPMKIRKIVIVGEKKMVVYDDVETLEKIRIYTKNVSKYDDYKDFGEFQLSYNYGDINIPKIDNKEPLKIELTHFLDCIEKNITPRSDGKSGLRVVKVLEAAQKSIKERGKEIFIEND